MGTVRAFPKRSEGPKGKRWNRPHGVADVQFTLIHEEETGKRIQ
ncbi:MAG: hypothetical protein ACOYVK_20545 [Bacillota bacterium]